MKKSNRYQTSHLIEDQYEPGSRKQVLKNKLRIKNKAGMDQIEALALQQAEDAFFRGARKFGKYHKFTAKDIGDIHGVWLSNIYEWAGRYRRVDMWKGAFRFAAPGQISKLMGELEEKYLSKHTPCIFDSKDRIVQALAEVHVELILIHPFREGNGRISRTLATLMALQADFPILNFSLMVGKKNKEYIKAIHAGMAGNYKPMEKIFGLILEQSIG